MTSFTGYLTPKLQGQRASCDAYFMVVMGVRIKAPLLVHKCVPHKCESGQWAKMSGMWKPSGNCGGHSKALLCPTKLERSPRLCPHYPEIFFLTQNQSPDPLWERKRCGDACSRAGRNQGPQNIQPLSKTAPKKDHIESTPMRSNLRASKPSKWGF